MRADQRKFGKSAWAAAVERMERLQYAVSKETLQLMRAKEISLEQKKHSLKEEVSRAAGDARRKRLVGLPVCDHDGIRGQVAAGERETVSRFQSRAATISRLMDY